MRQAQIAASGFPLPSSLSTRLSFTVSFALSVSPFAMCSAWAMLGSLVRSHSQVCTRSGLPKPLRKALRVLVSGN